MHDVWQSQHGNTEFSAADLAFSNVISAAASTVSEWLSLAAAHASSAVQRGDVCVTLDAVLAAAETVEADALEPIEISALRELLLDSGVVQAASEPVWCPLVLDGENRLYLTRYWCDETELARALLARVTTASAVNAHPPRDLLDTLFPPGSQTPDWQRVAAVVASRQRLSVITGGPGTGKTRTVARLLAVLQAQSAEPLDMCLLAPTGKAAARLLESLRGEAAALADSGEPVSLPEAAATLHRALGYRHGRRDFLHNASNPLPHDVVLVDEASMIDLSMMAALVDAVRADARLILLGDRDQLASVEAGNVLGDIVAGAEPGHYSPAQSAAIAASCEGFVDESGDREVPAIADAIVHLSHSYRFDANSGIGVFAAAVNAGLADDAVAALQSASYGDVSWIDPAERALSECLAASAVPHFQGLLASTDAEAAFSALHHFRVLCALRSGPRGVAQVNALVEQHLARTGLLPTGQLWYRGRPLLITRNDPVLGLYNGDMGLVWPDADGVPLAWFQTDGGQLRAIAPGRLPAHETCHAMTVHKTQGSEFKEVLMVLPDAAHFVLSRDLLYTGVTRARERAVLYSSVTVLREAIAVKRERASGLQKKVWIGV